MNIKVSSKLMLSFLMGKVRHALNNKYAVSLQYLKKELSYEVDVLHAVKHESILQADAFIFDGLGRHAQSTWASSLKKEVRNEVRDLIALGGHP